MFAEKPIVGTTRYCPFCKGKFKTDSSDVIIKKPFLGEPMFYHHCVKAFAGSNPVQLVQHKFIDIYDSYRIGGHK